MPRSPSPVRAADITRVVGGLFPNVSTSETGPGRFTVRLPAASATHWGVGNPAGRARAADYLTRHLAAPVMITDARWRKGARTAVDLVIGAEAARPDTRPQCATCGGRAIRSGILSAHPDPERHPWVHLDREDWQDNPHDVVIEAGDRPAELEWWTERKDRGATMLSAPMHAAAIAGDRPAADAVRDTDGTILRGPSLPCGCPLDSGCTGYHPGRLP